MAPLHLACCLWHTRNEESRHVTVAAIGSGFNDPALHVALALIAGVVSLSLARHLRVPGIVVLLGVGILLGPDVAAGGQARQEAPGLR